MIKVNLVNQKAPKKKKKDKAVSDSEFTGELSAAEGDLKRGLLVRIVILLIIPVGLFLYEDSVLPDKAIRLSKMQADLDELTRKNREAAAAVDEIKKFEKDQEKLQQQTNTLISLSKDRIKEVRVLDYIQREIPAKVWLLRMDLSDGRLQISGMASTDGELTTFMETLQRSAYLKDVNLVRSDDSPLQDFGIVKKFEISCLLERGG